MGSAEGSPPARAAGRDAGGQVPVTIPRGAYVAAAVMACVLGAAAIVRGTSDVTQAKDSDLTSFFFPAADAILNGHPWQIYAVRAFGGYPNYNPPISIFLMAPLLQMARSLGLGNSPGGEITFVTIPFIGFVLLLGYVVIVALRRLFPAIPETQRFLAYILILFGPLTWQTFTIWYHVEQPLMLALLVGSFLAFQDRREALGGLLAGLAVLSRTTALIPLIAFGVLLLAERRWRPLATFGGVAALVTGAGLAPFFLFDRADAVYSLVSWRGGSEIGGNSIWSLFRYAGTRAASPLRYTLDHFARRLDMYSVVALVAIVAYLAARRLRVSAYRRDAWAVLAIAALAVPMLSKVNWPYYYLEPFVFLLIWEFASMHDRRAGVWRWPVLTFGFLSVAATLSQFIGLQSVGALDRVVVGLLEFAAMLGFAVAVWHRAGAARDERQQPAHASPFTAGLPAGPAEPGAWAGRPALQAAMPGAPAPRHPDAAPPMAPPFQMPPAVRPSAPQREAPPAWGGPASGPGQSDYPTAPGPYAPAWGTPAPGRPAPEDRSARPTPQNGAPPPADGTTDTWQGGPPPPGTPAPWDRR